jgi:hypothetical protein
VRELGNALSKLLTEDRGWLVLHYRFGLGRKMTLENIGDQFGVTRERIRQIEHKALTRLWNSTLVLSEVCDALERNSKLLGEPFTVRRAALLRRISRVLSEVDYSGTAADRHRLILVFRAAHQKFGRQWPRATFLFCSLQPPRLDHPGIADAVEAKKEAERELSYTELAQHVLQEEDAPMHWHDLVRAAERAKRRKSITPSALFNAVLYRKDLFVRVASGTYGLVAWGLKERPSNVDLIAGYLKRRGIAAAFGDILQKVGAPHQMKTNSLRMSLDLNPRFYRSIEDEYGLRAWLPPREKQTLRIPHWKIESLDSYERVQRAIDSGYDVDAIAARDRE